jgi:hypothetical protein
MSEKIIEIYYKIINQEENDIRNCFNNLLPTYILDNLYEKIDDNLILLNFDFINENIQNNNFNYLKKFHSLICHINHNITIIKEKNIICKNLLDYRYLDNNWNKVIVNYILPGIKVILFYTTDWNIYIYDNDYNFASNIILEFLKKNYINDDINKNYKYLLNINLDEINNLSSKIYKTKPLILLKIYDEHNQIIYNYDKLYFSCIDEIFYKNIKFSYYDENNKNITYLGFVINFENTNYIVYHLVYLEIKNIFQKYNNINILYLDLFKKYKLNYILPFINSYSSDIISRINISIKTISYELLNLYHITRKKDNKYIFNLLTEIYINSINKIHNIYLLYKKSTNNNLNSLVEPFILAAQLDNLSTSRSSKMVREERSLQEAYIGEPKTITVHDIYYYIMDMDIYEILKLYHDRIILMNNDKLKKYFKSDCIYCLVQKELLFKKDEINLID